MAVAEPFPDRLTRADGQTTFKPVDGITDDVTLMVPTKLFVLARDTEMKAPVEPELKFTELVTVILKSPT